MTLSQFPTSPGQTPTPGPWHIGKAHTDDEGYVELPIHAIVNGKLATPAAVCLQFPYMPGMQDANARLIAAAPDLLAALRALVDSHAVPSSICAERPAYEAARAAIQRATGEQS